MNPFGLWGGFAFLNANIDGILEKVEKFEDILDEDNIVNTIKS